MPTDDFPAFLAARLDEWEMLAREILKRPNHDERPRTYVRTSTRAHPRLDVRRNLSDDAETRKMMWWIMKPQITIPAIVLLAVTAGWFVAQFMEKTDE